jgi:hypothetical protein
MSGQGGFQVQAYPQPSMAVAGDFCSQNPYFTLDAGPGGLVAGSQGVSVGLFAWLQPPVDPDSRATQVYNYGSGPPAGFVHREQQGLIITYLANAGMVIQKGFQMTLMVGGDFWIVNNGSTQAIVGNKAYANNANGQASFAASGASTSAATSTASTVTAQTSSFTGSISGDVLTVTAVGSGTIYPGTTLSGTAGGTIATGTQVLSQISGTIGGVGTYYVGPAEQNISSSAISGTYGLLTVGGTVSGTFAVNNTLTGTGVVANTVITAAIGGVGGTGTYVVNNNTAVGSSAINVTGVSETAWYAVSSALPGELVKMSTHFSSYYQSGVGA